MCPSGHCDLGWGEDKKEDCADMANFNMQHHNDLALSWKNAWRTLKLYNHINLKFLLDRKN